MIRDVETYFAEGCGRCSKHATPECKVHVWPQELQLLRSIALECGLAEESKWGVPCYTFNKKNILIVAALKDYAALSFFKGALLSNSDGLLVSPGKNSQAIRHLRFTSTENIIEQETAIKSYIFEAIEIEKAGLKVEYKKTEEYDIPEELQQKFDEMPSLKTAFDALTPGRQRGYLHYIAHAKLSKTRKARVEKYIPKIYSGKGVNE